jgi:hypothetical protein
MSYSEAPWCAKTGIEIRKKLIVNAARVIRSLFMQPPESILAGPAKTHKKSLGLSGDQELLLHWGTYPHRL